jgi:WD40 repeat protein
VAYSHDGRRVLSASWDRTAALWDVAGGQELRRFDPDTEEVLRVAFSPDDRWGASAGSDTFIRLWHLQP